MSEANEKRLAEKMQRLITGPRPNVVYPIEVIYCGNCSLPLEYCEFNPEYAKCLTWLQENLPEEYERQELKKQQELYEEGSDGVQDSPTKHRQKRGGKGNATVTPRDIGERKVTISRAPRGKRKSVTVVSGLSKYDIDLKNASKFFGTKFACGSSVTGEDEIVVQGDFKDDLLVLIPEKWPQIDAIDDLGNKKR